MAHVGWRRFPPESFRSQLQPSSPLRLLHPLSCFGCPVLLEQDGWRRHLFPGSVFELLHRSYHLGPMTSRVVCQEEVARSDYVHVTRFEEGLGRVMYVVGALEYERPLRSPLYNFKAFHPKGSVRSFTPYVSFIVGYDHSQQALLLFNRSHTHLSFAACRCTGQRLTHRRGELGVHTQRSRASKSLTFLVFFARDHRTSGPTLAALAVLLALKMFHGKVPPTHRPRI